MDTRSEMPPYALARVTTPELAAISGLPATTVAFLVHQGLLEPSLGRGDGRGTSHVWSLFDVVAATAMNRVRKSTATAKDMQTLVGYFGSKQGKEIVQTVLAQVREERLLILMSDRGAVEATNDVEGFITKTRSEVVYVIDAGRLIRDVLVKVTEFVMTGKRSTKRPPLRTSQIRDRKSRKRKG